MMLVENPRASKQQNNTTVTFTPSLPVATTAADNIPPIPPIHETPATTVENPDIELAGAGRRIAAYLINFCLFWIPFILFFTLSLNSANHNNNGLLFMLFLVLYVGAYSVLQLIFMVAFRQTIGKKILGLHLVERNTLQPITFGRYVGRELAECGLVLFTGLITVVNFILLFAHQERQTTSDMIAATLVVVKKKQA